MWTWAHSEESGGKPAGGRMLKMKFPKFWRGGKPKSIPSMVADGPHLVVAQPQTVTLTFEQNLERHHFREASCQLIERENGLFSTITEAEAPKHLEEEVNKLAADRKALEESVLQTLRQSLSLDEAGVTALTSAVNVVQQEEEQDQLWKQTSGTPPPWRPSNCRNLHDAVLYSLVEECMDRPLTPSPVEQSSLQANLNGMGKRLKEDLTVVVGVVKRCYPPEMNICQFYAGLYHRILSSRLTDIADFGLEDKDCMFLLRWVNDYYPGLLQKPQLANEIDAEALGKLLPEKFLEPLEEQFISKQQSELMTFIIRVLEEAKAMWVKGEEPTREEGCFVSPVAYDIIQLVNGIVTSAEVVVGDMKKAHNITSNLDNLLQRFRAFQDIVIKQNKPNSKPFIKANLGCVEQFRDFLTKKTHLFLEDVQENCLSVLTDMKQSAHMYLLTPVHQSLKQHYRKLGTSDWLNNPQFDKLLVGIKTGIQDLQGLTESCYQDLIGQFHQEVTVEYVRRLLKGEVKLKDREQQHKAYRTMMDNAQALHSLFIQQGSQEEWLKNVLPMIAGVLDLQDLPAIQMQVVSLGTAFPDLSEKHVSALLRLKTNLSKADRSTVKAILSVTLKETRAADTCVFFSRVHVK